MLAHLIKSGNKDSVTLEDIMTYEGMISIKNRKMLYT